MSLSYWNSQFQFTRLLPDFQNCLDRMAARSAETALRFEKLSYGPDPRQFVELSGTPQPGRVLPVFIHGGYWRALTAETHRFVLPSLAGAHGAVANLEYRLLPHVTLAEIVADALAGLRRIADQTGCPLVIVGHSAGGHLAVMGAHHLPQIVAGAVGISGLYDLTPLQWSFLREEVGLQPRDLDGQSPLALWDHAHADHLLLAVGAEETPEFRRQSQIFASLHGARIITVEGAHHMTVLDALADDASSLSSDIQNLIRSLAGSRFNTTGP